MLKNNSLFYLVMAILLFMVIPARSAIYINVGETYTCDLGYVSHFKECVWTTTDYSAIDFVGTPSRYDTSVTVQCLSKPTYATPVTIHCQYYYYDLDPVSGRYIYLRSDYKDFQFFVRDNGPTGISLYPTSLTLDIGDAYTLNAAVTPSSADQSVTWETSNFSVASVNSYGRVEARGGGEAVITATTVNGKTAECYVYVNSAQPTDISVSPTSLSLEIGDTRQLSYSLVPSNAKTTVTWSSTDASVASVSSSGLVSAKSEGSANIRVFTSNGLSATCRVQVSKPVPTRITLSKNSLSLPVGSSQKFSYSVSASNAIYSVSWSSDNTNVATVSSNGTVTAVNSGTARVTVRTDNGCTDFCVVNVPPLPQSISLPAEITLNLRKQYQLSCDFYPSNAVASVSWQSSDASVAAVTQAGLVTARGVGQARIEAMTSNGLSASCSVIVPMPDYQLVVWTRDGSRAEFAFADKPQVTIEGDKFVVATQSTNMEFLAVDILRFTLEDAAEVPENPSQVDLQRISQVDWKLSDGQLRLSGCRPGSIVSLFSASGQMLYQWRTDDEGSLVVDFSGHVQGIYIVKTETISFKIIKK